MGTAKKKQFKLIEDTNPILGGDLSQAAFDIIVSASGITASGLNAALEEINNSASSGISLEQIGDITGEPMGFPNCIDSEISFDHNTRTFTIAPTGDSFDFYVKGTKYTKTSGESVTIPDTEGTYYIVYNDSGTLESVTPLFDLSNEAPVSIIYWDQTNSSGILFAEERHSLTMDWATHLWAHLTIGTRFQSGLTLGNFTISGNGGSDSHNQISIENGIIADEDLIVNITHSATPTGIFEQYLTTIAQIPIYYRDGANGDWRKLPATNFPITTTGTGRAAFNEFTGGSWQLSEVTNTDYVAMWLFATNDINEPIIAIMGQDEYTNLNNADQNATYESLTFGNLPIPEMKIIYRLISQSANTYGNAVKSRLRDIQDLRGISNLPAGTYIATDHGLLTGLQDQDHSATAIYTEPSGFNTILSASDTDVQLALDTLDDLITVPQIISDVWTHNDDLIIQDDGVIQMQETTTPAAVSGYGKIYTKADNKLYFQDGSGFEHAIQLL